MREIKFRAWGKVKGEMFDPMPIIDFELMRINGIELMQFTGLKDKNGKDVYEGDVIRFRTPYRTTQTHYGDNIPNGAYTEPMEPGIKTTEDEVKFLDYGFGIETDSGSMLLMWCVNQWDLDSIKESISYGRPDRFVWDDPEEGDLQYLMEECAKVKTSNELIEYLSGIEITGNIYENAELLKS